MPVKLKTLTDPKGQPLDPIQARAWVRRVGARIPDDRATQAILPVFLANWNRAYGFLQQAEFLRDLEAYVEQTELLHGIGDLGERIMTDFPPHVYLYVGIGRSPAPIIAYLESRGVRTFSIPLSDFRPRNVSWSITDDDLVQMTPNGVQGRARMTQGQQQSLFDHFRRYFPARPKRSRILVLDYTQSALSLLAAQEQLQLFFRASLGTADVQVHALGLCRDSDAPTVRAVGLNVGTPRSPWPRLRDPTPHVIDWFFHSGEREEFASRWHVLPLAELGGATRRQALVMSALSGQRFDGLAEYGSFRILEGAINPVRYTGNGYTAGYDVLREEMRNANS